MRNLKKSTSERTAPRLDCGVWNVSGNRVAQYQPNKRYAMGSSTRHRVRQWRSGSSLCRSKCNSRKYPRPAHRLLKRLDAKIGSRSDNCCLRIWGMVTDRPPRRRNRDLDFNGTNNASCEATTDVTFEACVFRSPDHRGTRSFDRFIPTKLDSPSNQFVTANPRPTSTRQTSDFCDTPVPSRQGRKPLTIWLESVHPVGP